MCKEKFVEFEHAALQFGKQVTLVAGINTISISDISKWFLLNGANVYIEKVMVAYEIAPSSQRIKSIDFDMNMQLLSNQNGDYLFAPAMQRITPFDIDIFEGNQPVFTFNAKNQIIDVKRIASGFEFNFRFLSLESATTGNMTFRCNIVVYYQKLNS